MLPIYTYQSRLTFSTLFHLGEIDSCYLNLPGSMAAASIPKRGSHSFCFDSDQPLHWWLWLCVCCEVAELPEPPLLRKSAWVNTLPSKQVASIVAVTSLIAKEMFMLVDIIIQSQCV